jgi:hypothetical protein
MNNFASDAILCTHLNGGGRFLRIGKSTIAG